MINYLLGLQDSPYQLYTGTVKVLDLHVGDGGFFVFVILN